jgi:isocitrate dehydrogenase
MMSGFQKIKVENPVVEMDGDEMTRYMREPIFSSLIQNTK